MKTIKLSIIALIVACSFQVASAQVRVGVGVNIGNPPPRTVIVERRAPIVYSRHRPVVYRRPVIYRRHYARPMPRRIVYARPHYNRHW